MAFKNDPAGANSISACTSLAHNPLESDGVSNGTRRLQKQISWSLETEEKQGQQVAHAEGI